MYVTSQQQTQEIVQIFFFRFSRKLLSVLCKSTFERTRLAFSLEWNFSLLFTHDRLALSISKIELFSDILSFSFYSCCKDFCFIFFSLLLFTLRCSQWYREHRKGWEKGWERLPALTAAATSFKLASFTCFREFFWINKRSQNKFFFARKAQVFRKSPINERNNE